MAAIGHRGPYKPSRPVPCACYPSFAGLHKRPANSLLVEAQSLTVNAEGIEKELKGHYATGSHQAATEMESAQLALYLRRAKCWVGSTCAQVKLLRKMKLFQDSVNLGYAYGYASENGAGKPGLQNVMENKTKPNL